jgi:hypothetical protein
MKAHFWGDSLVLEPETAEETGLVEQLDRALFRADYGNQVPVRMYWRHAWFIEPAWERARVEPVEIASTVPAVAA